MSMIRRSWLFYLYSLLVFIAGFHVAGNLCQLVDFDATGSWPKIAIFIALGIFFASQAKRTAEGR